jgi:hypothetical protein
MIGRSDRQLSSLSGANANRFLDRHNKNSAVIHSSCSGLTYDGLNRAPNTVIRNDDFKFKLRQKVVEVLAARRDGRVFCPPPQHLYFTNGYPFDSDFDQGFSYLVHSERFDNRLDLLHFIPMLRHFPKESNQARAIACSFNASSALELRAAVNDLVTRKTLHRFDGGGQRYEDSRPIAGRMGDARKPLYDNVPVDIRLSFKGRDWQGR